ncbi:MAG: hypothetical protein AAFU85_12500 [Planctomycetota bacterium]
MSQSLASTQGGGRHSGIGNPEGVGCFRNGRQLEIPKAEHGGFLIGQHGDFASQPIFEFAPDRKLIGTAIDGGWIARRLRKRPILSGATFPERLKGREDDNSAEHAGPVVDLLPPFKLNRFDKGFLHAILDVCAATQDAPTNAHQVIGMRFD